MRHSMLLVAAACGSMLAIPSPSVAQDKQDKQDGDLVNDLFDMLTVANWNVFLNGGASRDGRFLLQEALTGGQRALRGQHGWNIGLGGGLDFLPRIGARMAFNYTSSDLVYRTDIGDGSDVLDIDDGAGMNTYMLSLEIMRYIFPYKSSITPYATAGLTGAWWNLDESPTVRGGTEFRVGAVASFGVQFAMTNHVDARLELASGTNNNPFTGRDSFIGLGGLTIDEPTRVNKTDFRIAGVYRFTGRDEKPAVTVTRGRGRGQSRR